MTTTPTPTPTDAQRALRFINAELLAGAIIEHFGPKFMEGPDLGVDVIFDSNDGRCRWSMTGKDFKDELRESILEVLGQT